MSDERKALSPAPHNEPPLRGFHAPRRSQSCRMRPRGDATAGAGVQRVVRESHAAVEQDELIASARKFAERSLRLTLEVLDQRRPLGQLASIAEPAVVSAIRTLIAGDLTPGRGLGAAVLARVAVTPVDPRTAEVFAGYDRGPRRFALAGRIVHTRTSGWRWTALRIR
ncbi:Rv3235 family protein [Nocardia amikacinitolerans]|uniref:Rv3235 family protein n=1 Tax=Nocardia amikacinitolerans TaxID=756689 RepID=UPI0036C3A78E